MSATDELRRLLDERGIEWADQFGPFPVTAYKTHYAVWIAKEYTDGLLSIETRPVTPEQAIAATLGSGKLTAEQVRECVKTVYLEGYSDGSVSRGAHIDETDWQAIADELNAALGSEDTSRYDELFGAPERAARTLEEFELDQLNWCRGTEYCESCPYEFDRYGCYLPDGFELLEWLRGDAE